MAIRPEDEYVNADPASASYPEGSFKNESVSGLKDGTPFEKAWPNDFLGYFQKLLDYANITPSGVPDTVLASDYFDGLQFAISKTYSALKDYAVGERVIGSDYNIYKCLIANGPSSSVVSPISDTTSTWVLDLDNNTYSAYIDYAVNKRVIGSDGNEYKCLIANGPASSVVNPVGDTTGTWGNNWMVMHVQDQKASGTSGGGYTAGSRVTRVLNTAVVNTISGASLSSNQITLPIGKYKITSNVPGFQVDGFRAWLYNVTDTADALRSTTQRASSADSSTIRVLIRGEITITASKVFEVQFRGSTTSGTAGLGTASNFDTEVYTEIYIERIDG